MKKLLSLPPNLVECFHDIEKADQTEESGGCGRVDPGYVLESL